MPQQGLWPPCCSGPGSKHAQSISSSNVESEVTPGENTRDATPRLPQERVSGVPEPPKEESKGQTFPRKKTLGRAASLVNPTQSSRMPLLVTWTPRQKGRSGSFATHMWASNSHMGKPHSRRAALSDLPQQCHGLHCSPLQPTGQGQRG